ncbi:MAG: hypothetical protein RLZZ451_1340 [Pseudomonadota bacterium]
MKKLNTVALLFASAALAAPISAYAQPRTVDNWRASDGTPWRNGTNELCWRDAGWTPATADPACDGAVKPPPPPAPPRAADSFFATGSSVLNAESQAKLADLVDKTKAVNLEVIIAVGHTDITGSAALNQRLSTQRAESVKKFLVSKGIEANRVYTEGKGSANPVADNKTAEGRAKNRRVEVEVVGTRTRRP